MTQSPVMFEAKASSDQKPGTAEVKLAEQLIDSISSPAFDAKAYHDEYRERVMELIEEKSKGKTLKLQRKAARPATVAAVGPLECAP
jgi:DNA end-binding protein Ku